jgi:hypothetical protein
MASPPGPAAEAGEGPARVASVPRLDEFHCAGRTDGDLAYYADARAGRPTVT